ncbi:TIGR03086 family metal-binding protein [Nocardioides currus]|uniref:TIGR03086 family protein n=1 Tax=Nocardioides currus TaxID=2133958 RepID=A0A2R7YVR4_9ACTN|nr:TIGR03086 family metal-binding protein [Nocardioides currus]PUA80404.1 TIGR03086 family protein [Nocardioides currus]
MTETADKFMQRADAFGAILDRVDGAGEQPWDAPTPCDDWSVRDVVEHAIETERDFLTRQDLEPGPAPDLGDLPAAWRRHAAGVAEVLGRDGVAEREYDGYFGRTTIADTMADFYGWDLVIHGSDVARATGQPWSISEEEAASLHATADSWGDALYSEGVCTAAVPVPDDASATDRLLARLGRDPQWDAARV